MVVLLLEAGLELVGRFVDGGHDAVHRISLALLAGLMLWYQGREKLLLMQG
jgi:hypothetical protein